MRPRALHDWLPARYFGRLGQSAGRYLESVRHPRLGYWLEPLPTFLRLPGSAFRAANLARGVAVVSGRKLRVDRSEFCRLAGAAERRLAAKPS